MATRGRPKGSKNQSTKSELDTLKEANVKLSISNETLWKSFKELEETISYLKKQIDERDNEIGSLEDEKDHLKEIIKSLAEVL